MNYNKLTDNGFIKLFQMRKMVALSQNITHTVISQGKVFSLSWNEGKHLRIGTLVSNNVFMHSDTGWTCLGNKQLN